MKILITGSAGFIGSNFIKLVLEKTNHEIIGLDCLNYASDLKNLNFKSNRFNFIKGDIGDSNLVQSIDYDVVVNFAAETHVTRSINNSEEFINNDIVQLDKLLRTALFNKKLKIFIQISTSEVYGSSYNGLNMSEEHPLNPMSPYAAAKCGADRMVYSYSKTYDLPAVIIRPFNNYGPKQHLEKLIPRMICCGILNKEFKIHGDGLASRDYIHVFDTCNAILKLIDNYSSISEVDVYNIGSDSSISVIDILNNIQNHFNNNIKFKKINDRPGQVDFHLSNSQKFRTKFNWKADISLAEGINQTVNWYKNNFEWWENKFKFSEIRVVMPNGEIFYH